jgi:Zn-dependent protease with chaperone function
MHGQKGPPWTTNEKRKTMRAFFAFAAAVAALAVPAAYAGLSVQMTCALLTGSAAYYIWARRDYSRDQADLADSCPETVRQLTASAAGKCGVAAPPVAYEWDVNRNLNAFADTGALRDFIQVDDEVKRMPEAQAEAVIAHEIGHLKSRTRWVAVAAIFIGSTTFQFPVSLAAYGALLWAHRWVDLLILIVVVQTILSVVMTVTMQAARRSAERSADEFARKAGFGPDLAAVLDREAGLFGDTQTFGSKSSRPVPNWLRTHPPKKERVSALLK